MAHSEYRPTGNGKVRDRPKTLVAVIVAFLVATVAAVIVFRLRPGADNAFPLWLALTYAVLPYLAVFLPFLFRAMKRRRAERTTRDA